MQRGLFVDTNKPKIGSHAHWYWHDTTFPSKNERLWMDLIYTGWSFPQTQRLSPLQALRKSHLREQIWPSFNCEALQFKHRSECSMKIHEHDHQAPASFYKAAACLVHIALITVKVWKKGHCTLYRCCMRNRCRKDQLKQRYLSSKITWKYFGTVHRRNDRFSLEHVFVHPFQSHPINHLPFLWWKWPPPSERPLPSQGPCLLRQQLLFVCL